MEVCLNDSILLPRSYVEDQAIEFLSRGATSILVSEIIQYAKEWKKIPWLSDENRRNNFLAGVAGSILSAEGVHFALDASSTNLVFNIPLAAIPHAAWDGAKSWAMQQAYWRLAIKKRTVIRKSEPAVVNNAVILTQPSKV